MRRITNYFFSLLVFSICHLSSVICHAQPVASPDVKCLAVNPGNGDVTLTWVIPADPGGNFVSYNIYKSPITPTAFVLVGTVNTYTLNSFTDVGAGANAQRVYYKVLTNYNPGPVLSAPLDTFSTIFLSVTNPGNGTALLNWNKISYQPISTSTGWYKIYREYPTGVWTLRDSTQTLSYIDEIDICSSILNYRIEISDNTGCTSVSNEAGAGAGVFTDQTPPTVAPIDTVSVNAAGLATISWNQSPSPDAVSVVIYTGCSPWLAIDTVPILPAFYTHLASSASNSSECFRIAFLDSCNNISPQGIEHKTIYLSTSFDICSATASLVWNKYINWSPAANLYKVFRSVNAGPPVLITTQTSSDTNYVDAGLALGNSYCYTILATNGTKTSMSNISCFSATVQSPPAYHYNRYATVVSDKRIDIKAHVDATATSVKYYHVNRAINGVGVYSTIATLPPIGTVLSYTDVNVNAATNSYVYVIDAMDSCGNTITSSNPDTTMLLKANVASNLDITLTWNEYGTWQGGVDHYDIYRAVDGVWDPSPIGTSNTGSYTDDIASYCNSQGVFSYKVVAHEGNGNTFGFSDSSASNISAVYQYPKIYVPNAFTPNGDGNNEIFVPVICFVDPSSYTLRIFDNTGTQIMGTTVPTEGWDGKKKGHDCQEGVYMYLIQCKASNGDDSRLSGTVSLVR